MGCRLVVKLKNIFLYDENRKSFGKKTCHRILNMALIESRTDPDVNIRRIPYVSVRRSIPGPCSMASHLYLIFFCAFLVQHHYLSPQCELHCLVSFRSFRT